MKHVEVVPKHFTPNTLICGFTVPEGKKPCSRDGTKTIRIVAPSTINPQRSLSMPWEKLFMQLWMGQYFICHLLSNFNQFHFRSAVWMCLFPTEMSWIPCQSSTIFICPCHLVWKYVFGHNLLSVANYIVLFSIEEL